jgi:hypothetical protein
VSYPARSPGPMGIPGALARSHPATDLPGNADDAAGVTGGTQTPRPRGDTAQPGRGICAMALRCSCAGIERTPRSRQALQSPGRAPIEAAMTPEASSPSPPESSPGPSRGALRSGLRADGLPHKVLGTRPDRRPPRNANHPADVTGADIFGPVQLRRQWVAIHPQSADPQPGSSLSSEAPRACFSDRAGCPLAGGLRGAAGVLVAIESSGAASGLAQARIACGSGWRLPLGGDGVGVG